MTGEVEHDNVSVAQRKQLYFQPCNKTATAFDIMTTWKDQMVNSIIIIGIIVSSIIVIIIITIIL